MREFLHVDDMAAATVHVMNLDTATYQARTRPMMSHINVGSGIDCTIRELAETIAKVTGFTGRLTFDASKPDGMPRKLLDVSLLTSLRLATGHPPGTGPDRHLCLVCRAPGRLSGISKGASHDKKSIHSPASPARMAPTWPNFCWKKAMKSTASSAGPALFNTDRIDHLYEDPHETGRRLILHYGDLTDADQSDPHPAAGAARRGLQPGRPEPCAGLF
jgi:hypothetical protein